jgi:transcriptional antiterminator RfaH
MWVTESMFPTYLFARFNWKRSLDAVRHTFGVSGVVHFGGFWPMIPNQTIEDLRTLIGDEGIRLVERAVQVGEEVEIASGAFEGFRGIVARVMPARDRIAVLLDFLGRQTTVEFPMNGIVRDQSRHYMDAA